jgi:hypothetical protein
MNRVDLGGCDASQPSLDSLDVANLPVKNDGKPDRHPPCEDSSRPLAPVTGSVFGSTSTETGKRPRGSADSDMIVSTNSAPWSRSLSPKFASFRFDHVLTTWLFSAFGFSSQSDLDWPASNVAVNSRKSLAMRIEGQYDLAAGLDSCLLG